MADMHFIVDDNLEFLFKKKCKQVGKDKSQVLREYMLSFIDVDCNNKNILEVKKKHQEAVDCIQKLKELLDSEIAKANSYQKLIEDIEKQCKKQEEQELEVLLQMDKVIKQEVNSRV